MAAKVRDNGIQSLALQNKVRLKAEIFSHRLRDCDLSCRGVKICRASVYLLIYFISSFCQQSSAGAVELSDIKQLKAPPPLPPKPDRSLLRSQAAVMDGTVNIYKQIQQNL